MIKVMPSQIVQTIDELFPHAKRGVENGTLFASHGPELLGLLNLVRAIPDELINLSSVDYAEFVLITSTIEVHLETWASRGNVGQMAHVKGRDAVTALRRVLTQCPDEYRPSSAAEFLFIKDAELRESIRSDTGAVNRALSNAEWKAATVLAGATIEALLHWRLREPSPGDAAIQSAIATLLSSGTFNSKPHRDIDFWTLSQFIEVAAHLSLIKSDTSTASRLAQNFRNLIHPGRAARLNQICDRATAYSSFGALLHVIRDLE
jgi:hypothetical protein